MRNWSIRNRFISGLLALVTASAYITACSSQSNTNGAVPTVKWNNPNHLTADSPLSDYAPADAQQAIDSVLSMQVDPNTAVPTLQGIVNGTGYNSTVTLGDGSQWQVSFDGSSTLTVTDSNGNIQLSTVLDPSGASATVALPSLSSPTSLAVGGTDTLQGATNNAVTSLSPQTAPDYQLTQNAAYAAAFALQQGDGSPGAPAAPTSIHGNLRPQAWPGAILVVLGIGLVVVGIGITIAAVRTMVSKNAAESRCGATQNGDCSAIISDASAPWNAPSFCGTTAFNTALCSPNPFGRPRVGYQCFTENNQPVLNLPGGPPGIATLAQGCPFGTMTNDPYPQNAANPVVNGSLYACTQVGLNMQYTNCPWYGLGFFACSTQNVPCVVPVCRNVSTNACTGYVDSSSAALRDPMNGGLPNINSLCGAILAAAAQQNPNPCVTATNVQGAVGVIGQ